MNKPNTYNFLHHATNEYVLAYLLTAASATVEAQNLVQPFFFTPNSIDLQSAFGTEINIEQFVKDWQNKQFSFPKIEIVSRREIENTNSAFAKQTGKIYLAQEFLVANTNNLNAVMNVLLQEYGHYLNSQLNLIDLQENKEAITDRDIVQPDLLLTQVHRFYQDEKGFHLYTADATEIDYVQEKSESGELAYSYEAQKYQVLSDNLDVLTGEEIEGVEPIYRFFNTETGSHLYTINEEEKEYIQDNFANYNFEGIKYYAFKIEPENVKTIPVYRMLNTQSGAHLFSSDLNEIEYIEDNLPHFAMENEGNAAFHVLEL